MHVCKGKAVNCVVVGSVVPRVWELGQDMSWLGGLLGVRRRPGGHTRNNGETVCRREKERVHCSQVKTESTSVSHSVDAVLLSTVVMQSSQPEDARRTPSSPHVQTLHHTTINKEN